MDKSLYCLFFVILEFLRGEFIFGCGISRAKAVWFSAMPAAAAVSAIWRVEIQLVIFCNRLVC